MGQRGIQLIGAASKDHFPLPDTYRRGTLGDRLAAFIECLPIISDRLYQPAISSYTG